MRFSILILAAGNSSRLGQPKQLIELQGETLIQRITQTALSVSDDVLVVLGANSELIEQNLLPFAEKISTIFNPNWREGMGSSISIGTEILAKKSDAIVILLCDQPFVTEKILQEMLQTFAHTGFPIIACDYGNQLGVPMLFDNSIFPKLLQLKADKGARAFFNEYEGKIGIVAFQQGIFDIDTAEDLENLKKQKNDTVK